MKVWLRRAWKAAWREAGPARLKTLDLKPARVWPPEIRVGGASPSQEPKYRADGKHDRSGPISLMSTNMNEHQHGVDPEGWNAREVHTEDLVQSLMLGALAEHGCDGDYASV